MSKRSRRKKLRRLEEAQHSNRVENSEEQKTHTIEPSTHQTTLHHESRQKGILAFYDREYKKLLIIPFVLLLLAFAQIGYQYSTTGDFLIKGVSLKGGLTINMPSDGSIDIIELQESLSQSFSEMEINVRYLKSTGVVVGILIEADTSEDKIEAFVSSIEDETGIKRSEYAIEQMGSSLGESFFRETLGAILVAFLFMGIVVFLYFRTFVPSIAVILAAFSDMVITLAVANIIGMKISTAGIAAFLMLIGYSVDTDILLSTKLLKRKEGSMFERLIDAMKTGLTMTATTIIAVSVALFFAESEVFTQIMTIILIGLIVDLVNTWIQNVGILRLYLERKKK